MTRWKGCIYATINDEFEVDADTEEEAIALALESWQFVEVQDIDVERIDEVEEE